MRPVPGPEEAIRAGWCSAPSGGHNGFDSTTNMMAVCILACSDAPWMSQEDIAKGSQWAAELHDALKCDGFCLVCLTPENLESIWIAYEAGAQGQALGEGFVSPVLDGIRPSDVPGPLALFQSTELASRDDMRRLVGSINDLFNDPLPKNPLDASFDAFWSELEDGLESLPEPEAPAAERTERDMLEEIIEHVRRIDRRTPGRLSALARVLEGNDSLALLDQLAEPAPTTFGKLITTAPDEGEGGGSLPGGAA